MPGGRESGEFSTVTVAAGASAMVPVSPAASACGKSCWPLRPRRALTGVLRDD